VSRSITITILDATPPAVTAFTIPATSVSLTVSITSFTATDNVGVTGYMINESASKPSASATGWNVTAPATYTVASAGTKTLYAWAKDAAGNVSAGVSKPITITLPDTAPPTVTAFTIPATSASLTFSITSFTASDNVGVTGYMINESASKPSASATGWSGIVPITYTVASAGTKTLYAWAKDAAGNVSAGISESTTVTGSVSGNIKDDFNADGHSDILWRNTTNGQTYIWMLNGMEVVSQGFMSVSSYRNWTIEATGDFDGNGTSDVLWRRTDGKTVIWLMNGMKVVSRGMTSVRTGLNQAVGDIVSSDDNAADIVPQGYMSVNSGRYWTVQDSEGSAIDPTGVTLASAGPDWTVEGTGDFDGDGKTDILWQLPDGRTCIWVMNGTNVLSQEFTSVIASPDWTVEGIGDFDGDGRSDILWRLPDGRTNIWMMNGINVVSQGFTSISASLSWTLEDTGDFDGNGKSDILWRRADGKTFIWLMDGASVVSQGFTSVNAGKNWKIQ